MKDFKCLVENSVPLTLKSNECVRICLQCRLSVVDVENLFWIRLVTVSCHSLYYWCVRESIIMILLSIFFSVFIKKFDVFMLTWYVVQEIKTLHNSGFRNLRVCETAPRQWPASLESRSSLACLAVHQPMWIGTAQCDCATAGPGGSNDCSWPAPATSVIPWLCLSKVPNLVTCLNCDTNVLHFVLSHLSHWSFMPS